MAGQTIEAGSVAKVVEAQGVPPEQALERLIGDALLAASLRDDNPSVVAYLQAISDGRAISALILEEARDKGPPTDEEMEEFRKRNWLSVDRPPAAETAHVVVLAKPELDVERADAFLTTVLESAKGASTSAGFKTLVEGLARPEGLEIKVEGLPPVAEDGRVVDLAGKGGLQHLDVAFARAANAIEEPGGLSPITPTRFGRHVILLLKRHPGRSVPMQKLRELARKEVLVQRARRDEQLLLTELRKQHPTEIERAAAALMESVRIGP